LTKTVRRTLERHPEWPAAGRVGVGLQDPELQIVTALVGKELGFLDVHDELFTGDGLARCASEHVPMVGGDARSRAYMEDASSKNGTPRRNLFGDRSLRFSPVDEEFGADARANTLHGRNLRTSRGQCEERQLSSFLMGGLPPILRKTSGVVPGSEGPDAPSYKASRNSTSIANSRLPGGKAANG
jgi:hypothetical protein